MKLYKFSIIFIALLTLLAPEQAAARTRHHAVHHIPHRKVHHGAGVDAGAGYSDIVIDADTGRIIHDTDSDSLRHPASLTKMMTLYITFQALEAGKLSLGDYLPISENASYQSPSKLGLRAGQRIRVEDCIMGIVTESANDAAVTMGEGLGGSEEGFAQLMTKQARALGMTRTIFRNPSGLPDPDQVTTAHDMAILGAALIAHFPQYYPYFSHDSFTYAGVFHHNHNHLMDRYDGMDGIKTGYIRASGFNLVASAKHGSTRLIGVVFGGRSAVARDNHMAQLLDQSFAEAAQDARNGRITQQNAQGDGNDSKDNDYVELPGKIAAIFPSRGGLASIHTQNDGDDDDDAKPAQAAPAPVAKPKMQLVVQRPTAPVHGGGWGVQIGAYSDAAIGSQALAALTDSMPNLLGSAEAQVQKVAAGNTVMYRARLMALDKKTAQSVCSYLVQHGKSCLTVQP